MCGVTVEKFQRLDHPEIQAATHMSRDFCNHVLAVS